MKISYLFIFCLTLLNFGCSKNDDQQEFATQQLPELPESTTYDLNDDSVDDLIIQYNLGIWDGLRTSGSFIGAYVRLIDDNRVLVERDENLNGHFLFGQFGDSIFREVRVPQEWRWSFSHNLVSNMNDAQGVWPKEWTIHSEKTSNPYYLGIQIKEKDIFLVGWIKLEIDKKTGNISVVDHNLASGDYIVIDK